MPITTIKISEQPVGELSPRKRFLVVDDEWMQLQLRARGLGVAINDEKYHGKTQQLKSDIALCKTQKDLVLTESIKVQRFEIEQSTGDFCDVAINGAVALQAAKDAHQKGEPYTVIITDNSMPMMTGLEWITALRKFEEEKGYSPCSVLFVSSDTDIEQKIISLTGHSRLPKPVSPGCLQRAIATLQQESPAYSVTSDMPTVLRSQDCQYDTTLRGPATPALDWPTVEPAQVSQAEPAQTQTSQANKCAGVRFFSLTPVQQSGAPDGQSDSGQWKEADLLQGATGCFAFVLKCFRGK